MQITTDPSKITAALKAVRTFVSDDPSRSVSLGNIYAEMVGQTKVKFTATDGHTLCSVTIDGVDVSGKAARLTPIAVDTLLLQVKAAKGLTAAPFTFEDCTDQSVFPEYGRIVPERTNAKAKTSAVHGFNALYLARLGPVQKAIKAPACRIQFGEDERSPLRADMSGVLADAVVILMPLRLSDAARAA